MRRLLFITLLAAALAGCAGNPPQREEPANGDRCVLAAPDAPSAEAVVAVQSGRMNPTRRTLIDVDCTGNVRPGLAERYEGKGRHWVLALREGVHAGNGDPVNAASVARDWSEAIAQGGGVDSVRVIDEYKLEVFLERPSLNTIASADFAVDVDFYGKSAVLPQVLFTMIDWNAVDPRDELARGLTMTVDDPAFADYAASRGMAVAPLPYDRTFVLLVTGTPQASLLSSAAREDLVRAVRTASARPASTPSWWRDGLDGCADLSSLPAWGVPVATGGAGVPSIYYDANDTVARDLAERVVALAAMDTTRSASAGSMVRSLRTRPGEVPLAIGLTGSEMDHRLERGDGAAFVASIPNPVPDTCGSARRLLRRAPWLVAKDGMIAANVLPMIDTHGYVVLGVRNLAVIWDFYGRVRILPSEAQP